MTNIPVCLTIVALLYELNTILFHSQPEVPLASYLDMDVTKLKDSSGICIGDSLDGLDGEDNKETKVKVKDKAKDPLSMPQGPITRSRSKKLQEALIGYMQDWANQGRPIAHVRSNPYEDTTKWALFNVLQVQIHED